MMRKLAILLAAFALWAALPAESLAQTHGCACLSNRVGVPIQFKYQVGYLPWDTRTLAPNQVYAFCHPYGAGPKDSPKLLFQLDRDAGAGVAWTTYNIERVRGNTTNCTEVSPVGQYYVAFQANTNNQFLIVHRVQRPAAAPAPMLARPVQACACFRNNVGRPVNLRYAWGAAPLKSVTIMRRHNWGVCERVPAGQPVPKIRIQIDRDMSNAQAVTDYEFAPTVARNNLCTSIPAAGHYDVNYQPGTKRQMIHVIKR